MSPSPVAPESQAWSGPGTGDRARTAAVLVHGFTGNPRAVRPLGERLHEAGFSVEVLRLPGHGTSARDLGRTRYADWRRYVDDAVSAVRRDHDRVVLVGHSLGATLAVDIASDRVDEIDGVVAINTQVLDPTQPLARLAPVLQYVLPFVPRQVAGLPADDIARPGVTEHAYAMVPAKAAQSLIAQLPRIRAELSALTQPLLVVSSRVDHTVAPRNSDALAELARSRDLQRLVCERSYHVAQLDFDRELIEDAVVAFVEAVHAGTS